MIGPTVVQTFARMSSGCGVLLRRGYHTGNALQHHSYASTTAMRSCFTVWSPSVSKAKRQTTLSFNDDDRTPNSSLAGGAAVLSSLTVRSLMTTPVWNARSRGAPPRRSQYAPVPEEEEEKQQSSHDMQERPVERQMDVLRDKATVKHMSKVYGTSTSILGLATASSAVTMATGVTAMLPMGGLLPALASFVPLIMFLRTDMTSDQSYRKTLLGSFVGLSGMAAAPMIGSVLLMNPMAVPMALGGTVAIFAGATGVALMAPRASLLPMGSALGGATFALLGLGLVSIFFPNPMFFNIYLYGGLALFTAFIGYDTQQMIERFRAGDRDYLRHSLDFFIDLFNIFKMLLLLFSGRDD